MKILVGILGLILMVASGMGVGTTLMVFLVLWCTYVVLEDNKKKASLKEIQERTQDSLKYDPETGKITLTERNKSYAKMFDLERYITTHHGYSQEKLLFTSATVGGITTGGVDKIGGYGTEQKKTDRYNLVYKYVDPMDNSSKKGIVKEIVLSEELLEEAIHSDIRVYLNEDRIIVVSPLVSSEKEKRGIVNQYRISGGNSDSYVAAMANIEENDKIRTMPTFQKSIAILKWISNHEENT